MSGSTDHPSKDSGAPRDFSAIFRRIGPQVAALNDFMRSQVEGFEPEIRDMAAYCLDTTGKRLRPALVFFSGWQGEGVVSGDLVRAAGVIEMVHLATLVHDDIMDGAEIRRSRQTAARAYGSDAAVLLGDALFAQALHIAAQFPTTEVCRIVSESTRRVCSGEIMQTLHRREFSLSMADYWRIIDLKTAELFRSSCYLGSRLSRHGSEFVEAAARFGRHLGIGYQIYDDLLDFLGEEQRTGKTLGTDVATGKLTLPLMILLERLALKEREALIAAVREGTPGALAASKQRMHELGVGPAIVRIIEGELAAAEQALAPHAVLSPVPLLLQLGDLLKAQVKALQAPPVGPRPA
ncbi:MAG: polyprenyl synthetase family protein [Opitutaceae bacterium]|nr:polyprenyl synthetase family protein [Opitutaceae bacterium]